MNLLQTFCALGPLDARSIRRDSMLKWLIFLPLVAALAVRLVVPLVSTQLQLQLHFDLRPYYTLIQSFLFMVMPLLVGIVLGFLLLDQRDDRTLTALQVTPLTLGRYLAYRIALPVLLSFAATLIMLPLAGLGEVRPLPLLLTALCAAPLAPLFALFYAAFAKNKVQGFAVMKASGVVMMPPLFAYFIAEPWQWLCGILPTYWPVKLYWMLSGGHPSAGLALLAGLAYQALLIALLLRLFKKVMTAGDQ